MWEGRPSWVVGLHFYFWAVPKLKLWVGTPVLHADSAQGSHAIQGPPPTSDPRTSVVCGTGALSCRPKLVRTESSATWAFQEAAHAGEGKRADNAGSFTVGPCTVWYLDFSTNCSVCSFKEGHAVFYGKACLLGWLYLCWETTLLLFQVCITSYDDHRCRGSSAAQDGARVFSGQDSWQLDHCPPRPQVLMIKTQAEQVVLLSLTIN